MSAVKSGSTLRSLVLTPERIPSFLIPSRSPLLLSPCFRRISPERTRLLSDYDDPPGASPPGTPTNSVASPKMLFRLPQPRRIRRPRRANAAGTELGSADTDVTTRAAMSLSHVAKVTTPYGFSAVLAASPSTSRRESLFHRNKPVKVTVTEADSQTPGRRSFTEETSPPRPDPGRPRVSLRPVKALGLQMMKELKKPAAALKALSPSPRIATTR